ncbi:uncharacterized protein Dwil_GK14140 [Drosophila willistoni]|uniref:Prolyl 4-hydroxylase alpha subunit domain-containing protein n=1 Tax=Drosophila willistoni TaxID=7260 RepID=A0A0Q9X5M2_DROWI|nr:uncharacterized protein Dwil_GK14140 [Drosophila willistoni]
MEILSLNPYIVLCHDVILPSEQEFLKTQSSKRLEGARALDQVKNEVVFNFIRTSKATWLKKNSDNVTRRLSHWIEDVSNLDSNIGDLYQIINYGVGGLFEAHSDTMRKDELQDVPQGGATLFNNLNLTVFPKAGAALFWFNLDNAGDTDLFTVHTGCPVIVGSKWIMTKWVYDLGQELRVPCPRI